MDTFTLYLRAAETALANFLGTDDLDEDTIELVANCCRQAVEQIPNWSYFNDLLEKSASYVQCDMDEDTLNDYVAELEEQLEAYELL